jgi:hypothetical protein
MRAAATAVRSRYERRNQQERRPQVRVDVQAERRVVHVRRRPELVNPRVVDQDLNLADVPREAPHVLRVAQVGGQEPRPAQRLAFMPVDSREPISSN